MLPQVVSRLFALAVLGVAVAACSAHGASGAKPPEAVTTVHPTPDASGGAVAGKSVSDEPGTQPGTKPRTLASKPKLDVDAVRGTTVLHLGDSFAGALGIQLNVELEKIGVKGKLRYKESSYIVDWAWREPVNQYVSRYRPDLVLINVGANELEVADPAMRIKAIRKLVERVGDRPCVWIGVPLWEGARPDLMQVIRDNSAPCVFMDSAALLSDMERARDKIHPSMNARIRWAKLVVSWLLEHRRPAAQRPWEIQTTH